MALAPEFDPSGALALRRSSSINLDQTIAEWYTGNTSGGFECAKTAYNQSCELFRAQLTDEECGQVWLRSISTMQDVEGAVIAAKAKYIQRSEQSKVRKWLATCSSRVMYYGAIMDTLSQHHPEYVSLAWGALKFLFIAVINHEELLVQISKTVSRIAVVLPRAELCSTLYPTDRMNRAIAQLYAKIMLFVQDAVRWYKMGKIRHSLSAISNPYAISFKTIVEEIAEASRMMDKEANAASKAEIRGLSLMVRKLTMMQSQQTLLLSSISTQVANQAQWFQSTQLEQIRSLNTIASLPSSADAFEFSRAIRNRRRTAALMNPTEISKFRKWHSSKDVFPVLIAQGRGLMTSARDFAVDYVEILRSNKAPVIWLLPHTSIISEKPVSLNDTLLMLVIQLIQLNPRVLAEGSFPILPCHFQDAVPDEHNLEERSWRLLERCLEGMETLYIVVDLSFVHIVVNNNYARAATFLRRLQSILTARTGGGLKLVLASWISGRGLESNELDSLQRPQIFVDGPISRLSKRRVNRSNHLLVTGRAALRKRLVSL